MLENIEEKLKAIIGAIDVAETLTAPISRSIDSLLRQFAASMNCDEASVLVRDGAKGDLRFLTAIGAVADKLLKVKIPAGKGIAGFVFSSGSPMAIADVGQEAAFYDEVDRQTGYTTETLLATPLRFEGEVIGVLEFVNRIGAPPYESFTPDEMDKAALYAEAIATLVDAHEAASLIESLFARLLAAVSPAEATTNPAELKNWLKTVRAAEEHREMIKLALLVRTVANRGAAERTLAREILESIAKYADKNVGNETSFLSF